MHDQKHASTCAIPYLHTVHWQVMAGKEGLLVCRPSPD